MPSHKRGATGRNFAAEYAARVARAAARGLGLPFARGHPPAGQAGIKALRQAGLVPEPRAQSTLQRVYDAVRRMGGGKSLPQAAREAGVSPSTVRRYGKERGLLEPIPRFRTDAQGRPTGQPIETRGYTVTTSGTTRVLTDDGRDFFPDVDAPTASILGRYWNAVDQALNGDDNALRPFEHTVITDLHGNEYHLMSDPDAIRSFFAGMDETGQDEFWRTLYQGSRTGIFTKVG